MTKGRKYSLASEILVVSGLASIFGCGAICHVLAQALGLSEDPLAERSTYFVLIIVIFSSGMLEVFLAVGLAYMSMRARKQACAAEGSPRSSRLFALPAPPPERLSIAGAEYRLARVFKHDFFAATCLYEATGGTPVLPTMPKLVVKLYRTRSFLGFPLGWAGRWSRLHEQVVYEKLKGVHGVPAWAGRVGPAGFAVEYIDALPLANFRPPPPGYFERMRAILDAVHARGVAYVDANKRSNMLVGPDGQAWLIDFQISMWRREHWPWPFRAWSARFIRYFQRKDLYFLYKHKRRLCPADLTPEQEAMSHPSGWVHRLHTRLSAPYRRMRRRFLQKQYQEGKLVSPTAKLEDHCQPEKDSWRKDKSVKGQ
jgi:hypothetical protein